MHTRMREQTTGLRNFCEAAFCELLQETTRLVRKEKIEAELQVYEIKKKEDNKSTLTK